MQQFVNTIVDGASLGSIYSLMALAMILVWRSTRVVNFAQAGQAVLSTYIGLEIHRMTHSYPLTLLIAVLFGALFGALVDLLLVRPLMRRVGDGPIAAVAPVILTLGLLGAIQGFVGLIWGGEFRSFPAAFSQNGFKLGTTRIPFSPFDLFILFTTLFVMLAFAFIFQRSGLGLAMRAAAFEPEVAQLAGVRVSRVRTIGWAFAGGAGALAGALITPTTLLAPNSLDLLLVFGFTAAVLGGLESLIGGVVGGFLLGLGLALVVTYLGSGFTFMTAFVVLIAVLLLKPRGLIGQRNVRNA
ncbi:high-affinity branched-chain amino acid transport system permease protein LivH [mine drainage metagenome]|uniref:High-affinity branched-chain amino acid transport system permease protein LivH n=1 Tax=mine drainage metagenome TaxID=410659 RepID=A0A1J5PYF9_9ZZZZ